MSVLDDVIGMTEAAEIAGRAPVSMREAAAGGRLDAKRIGDGPGSVWVTTRQGVSEYLAYVAAHKWGNQPQRRKGRGRRGRRRSSRDQPG